MSTASCPGREGSSLTEWLVMYLSAVSLHVKCRLLSPLLEWNTNVQISSRLNPWMTLTQVSQWRDFTLHLTLKGNRKDGWKMGFLDKMTEWVLWTKVQAPPKEQENGKICISSGSSEANLHFKSNDPWSFTCPLRGSPFYFGTTLRKEGYRNSAPGVLLIQIAPFLRIPDIHRIKF